VASVGASLADSTTVLESGLAWLEWFEAQHPEYHDACRFRRATLVANHGRTLFERGRPDLARRYLRRSIADYGTSAWKAAGLLFLAWTPRRFSGRLYRLANRIRVAR
jgi:hypothetical protein